MGVLALTVIDKSSWQGTVLCRVDKWSEEAVEFARKRLAADGITHIQDGVELRPAPFRDRVASVIAGRDVSQAIVVPRLIPIEHGITSTELLKLGIKPEAVSEVAGNLLLNEGIQMLWDVGIAAINNQTSGNRWNNADSYIGVGDTATAEAATQTELLATQNAANRFYKIMNATFPSRANQTVTFAADFTTTEANFVWNEWTIASGATTASGAGFLVGTKNLNRKVAALGTKTTGTWTLSAAVTLS